MSKRLKTFIIALIFIGVTAVTISACTSTSMMTGVLGGGISLVGVIVLLISLGLSQIGCHHTKEDGEVSMCLSLLAGETDSYRNIASDSETDTATDTDIGVCLDISDDSETACLSVYETDTEIGVCLDTDACLSPVETDSEMSVCLDISYPETDSDIGIGVCLSIIKLDTDSEVSVCLDTDVCLELVDTEIPQLDAGLDTDTDTDTDTDIDTDTDTGTEVGPCLSMPIDSDTDTSLSPCLEAPVCLFAPIDTEDTVASRQEDCIPVLEQGYLVAISNVAEHANRNDIIEKLDANGVLPKDVASRLFVKKDKKS